MMKLKALMIAALAVVGTMSATAGGYKYETVQGDPMHTRICTLPNGLKVYLSVNKEKPRIQTYIVVRTGSRNDPAETTGLAHYLEHLMFKGTKQYGTSDAVSEAPLLDSIESRYERYRHITDPALRKACYAEIDSLSQLAARYNIPNEYDKLMAAIGSDGSNAYTSNDVTCYTEDIPSNEVDNWARIQADRFQNMVIRGFHTELEAVYEEYNIGLSSDTNKAWYAMCKKLYPTHPYGTQTTIGTQEHLKNPSIVNIKEYFHRYYVPNNVAICMSGDFDPDKVMAAIDRYFGAWKPSDNLSRPEYAPVKDLTAPADTTVVGQEAERLMLAWKFDGAASLQSDTLDVVCSILSNGKAGLMDLDLDQKMRLLGVGVGAEHLAEYSTMYAIGMPKQGQTLDEVRALLLEEIDKLKRGEFDDDLLPAVVNNMKLDYYKSLESNESRANQFVDAFVTGKDWQSVVDRIDRIGGMTKQQIVDFARRHLLDNYVAVYKVQGEDTTQHKIDKPHITAIPSNRDKQSQFVTEIVNSHPEPIQPVFVDFNRDITKAKTKRGLPVLYVRNNDNGLFSLRFHYALGTNANKLYDIATDYIDFLGTDKLTAEQIKQKFYRLACSWGVHTSGSDTYVTLSGLDENLPQALALLEEVLGNLKADDGAFALLRDNIKKSREDNKRNQKANFRALTAYAVYGKDYVKSQTVTNAELDAVSPQTLVDLVMGLKAYSHSVEYYGPSELSAVTALVDKTHKTAKRLAAVPEDKDWKELPTPKNEIIIAPYDAKNIYMTQYCNENRQWKADNMAVITLFNEYFGGGMNTIVFQELRESRALAYSAASLYTTPSRKGYPEYVRTYIISQNDKMMDCVRTFNDIINTMPQSEKSFQLAKQALMKRIATERTSRKELIGSYEAAKKLGIDYDIDEQMYRTVPSLTLQDIVRFEQQTMAHKPYLYIILGDEKNLDMESLSKIAPIRRITTDEIFGY